MNFIKPGTGSFTIGKIRMMNRLEYLGWRLNHCKSFPFSSVPSVHGLCLATNNTRAINIIELLPDDFFFYELGRAIHLHTLLNNRQYSVHKRICQPIGSASSHYLHLGFTQGSYPASLEPFSTFQNDSTKVVNSIKYREKKCSKLIVKLCSELIKMLTHESFIPTEVDYLYWTRYSY